MKKSNNQQTRDQFESAINNVWGRLDLALKEALDASRLLQGCHYERGPEPAPRAVQLCDQMIRAAINARRDAQDLLDECTRQNNVRLSRQSAYEYYVAGINAHGDAISGDYFPTKQEAMEECERLSATFNCVNRDLVTVATVLEKVKKFENLDRTVIHTAGDETALRLGGWID